MKQLFAIALLLASFATSVRSQEFEGGYFASTCEERPENAIVLSEAALLRIAVLTPGGPFHFNLDEVSGSPTVTALTEIDPLAYRVVYPTRVPGSDAIARSSLGLYTASTPPVDPRLAGILLRCPEAYPELLWKYGEALSLFSEINGITTACQESDSACLQSLLSVVDVSLDNEISPAEIARMLRAVAFFSAALSGAVDSNHIRASVPEETVLAAIGVATLLGPSLARSIVEGSDYNGNGTLSVSEVMQDRGTGVAALFGATRVGGFQVLIQGAMSAFTGVFGQAMGAIF